MTGLARRCDTRDKHWRSKDEGGHSSREDGAHALHVQGGFPSMDSNMEIWTVLRRGETRRRIPIVRSLASVGRLRSRWGSMRPCRAWTTGSGSVTTDRNNTEI